jgi:hypothetical protein
MSPILKLDHDDPELEREFELEYQQSLTTEQRFQMLFRRMREINELLTKHGHRKTPEIIKRT